MSEQPPSTPEEVVLGPDGKPLTKSAIKKAAAKAKKEEIKAKRAAENAAKQAAQASQEPSEGENFRDLPLIQSQGREGKVYTEIGSLNKDVVGQNVWIRGRLHTSRVQGGALVFLVLRERAFSVQAVIFTGGGSPNPKGMNIFSKKIPKESIVDIYGLVKAVEAPIETTTQQFVEIDVTKVLVVSRAAELPIKIEELSIPQPELKAQSAILKELKKKIEATNDPEEIARLRKEQDAATKYVKVSRKVRLDNRVIDLRTQANQAIFQIQSAVGFLFREFLVGNGFTEIHSPKLIGASSEGGANVFRLKYFEQDAFLAQSPQLYKQMCIAADFNRVFEIGPVFRAEDSNTHRHLCEFVGLDLEMAFKEHYHEVTDVLGSMMEHICNGLQTRYARQLEVISQQFPFAPFVCKKFSYNGEPESFRIPFPDGVKMLNEAGWVEPETGKPMGEFDDLSTPGERFLGQIVKEKFGTDFYILDKYPLAVRPFYTMPDPNNPNLSNSYDMFMRGEEICSGAQRIHDPELLLQRVVAKGVNPAGVQAYIDAFKFGCPPHGGGGIGLERVAMLYMALGNIRRTSLFPRDPKRLNP